MDTRRSVNLARKACMRCRSQKRRCDRSIPECGLCRRRHQTCQYETRVLPPPSPLSSSPLFNAALPLETVRPGHIKADIVDRLGSTPGVTFSTYDQSIHPWFPILSKAFRNRLPQSWDEVSLDCALLAFCIGLLCTTPHSSSGDESAPSEFQSRYLQAKSWISAVEGLGINSAEIVQARTLVTLFEVAHGFYPAAYISIAATARAADALRAYPCTQPSALPTDHVEPEETVLIKYAIRILDRYITIHSGPYPSLTRSLAENIDSPKRTFWPSGHEEDAGSAIWRFSRTFEASTLLDNIHNALHNPTAERAFNIEEVQLLVETSNSLRTILAEEVVHADEIYSGAVALCDTGLLLAYENGSKLQISDEVTANCHSLGTLFLDSVLTSITDAISPFVSSPAVQAIDLDRLPPFALFLVYKAAVVVTERVWLAPDSSKEALRKLQVLRGFLSLVGARWLCCKHYIHLLNEDTTPRTLKAIERQSYLD
ncbi:hypothetical protein ASPVEDRAFT_46794 [Aspergillus versicolor CBS 583.65]|uniref:Zn(2)-C6 fungal-type domain-containing protein n=1 Tax=Aspergillus versicolor CBS 583.65 TaxID=1036611 RepID=A0A1L9Q1C8_ASPVE|nr:uncharacterized protein ASPVEDRAFT_46794 [Aspergillus versicolor CBS 583.65]OJJ07492.1 hypothetical protein ASPVEDRAFT_46794 [Aspergillus versicolor CBS 583.65]